MRIIGAVVLVGLTFGVVYKLMTNRRKKSSLIVGSKITPAEAPNTHIMHELEQNTARHSAE